jgi:hypothetical protein
MEKLIMSINDLFENISNIFNKFAEEILAEQAHKNELLSRRGPESKGKISENLGPGENQRDGNFLAQEPV